MVHSSLSIFIVSIGSKFEILPLCTWHNITLLSSYQPRPVKTNQVAYMSINVPMMPIAIETSIKPVPENTYNKK
jgi:hypothetical protein